MTTSSRSWPGSAPWYWRLATPALLAMALTWGHAIATAAQAGKAPQPYAVLDWHDQLNPDFVALGQAQFLVNTKSGVKVWDARSNTFASTGSWPALLGVSKVWSDISGGRIVVARAGNAAPRTPDQLLWWRAATKDFSRPLALPVNEKVMALVPMDEHHVLACAKTKTTGHHEESTHAFVITQREGDIQVDTSSAKAMRARLRAASVAGEVDGIGPVDDGVSVEDAPPLRFNTRACKWEVKQAPPEFAGFRDPQIKPYRLSGGRWLLGPATWYDTTKHHWRELAAPYLWQADVKQWVAITNTAQNGNSGDALTNYGLDDPVVSVSATDAEFIEFLDSRSLRWTRSEQTFGTDAYSPIVAPLGPQEALVFLRERGEVFRFTPMLQPEPGKMAYSHAYVGEVPLRDGGVILLNGGGWRPSNRPESILLRPQARSHLVSPVPRPLGYASGLELPDNSILLFGGLPSGCIPESTSVACTQADTPSAYRYVPASDSWTEVPDLRIAFSNGEPWSFGNSSITSRWARQDAWVRHNGDVVVLDGPSAAHMRLRDMTPAHTDVLRWRPGEAPTRLGRLLQARTAATLIELNDHRLVVLGGKTAKRLDVDPDVCEGCEAIDASTGVTEPDTSTEVYDDARARWAAGPHANHMGGRAYKLANGRIFKLSTAEPWSSERGYLAEVADAAFTHWQSLPPFPLPGMNVSHVAVAGNRVLIQMDEPSTQTVVWHDERQQWLIWDLKTAQRPLSIIPIDADHGLARSYQTYELVTFPK